MATKPGRARLPFCTGVYRPMRVFLVDDSTKVIERLKEMLAPLPGVELVGTAADIPEAMPAIRVARPDVVLLDLHMPSGSGVEVLQALKQEMPAINVIVLTNYAFPQYEKKCMEAGAHAFLDKSTDFIKVPQVIQALSKQQGRLRPPHPSPGPESHSHRRIKVGS